MSENTPLQRFIIYAKIETNFFLKTGIHTMEDWKDSIKQGVTRKRRRWKAYRKAA